MRIAPIFPLLLMVFCSLQTTKAQTAEPNLKWGKPTDTELKMTEYAADKEADVVELCRMVDVNYDWIANDFRVFYRVKCRLKVLKPEGKRVDAHSKGAVPFFAAGVVAGAVQMDQTGAKMRDGVAADQQHVACGFMNQTVEIQNDLGVGFGAVREVPVFRIADEFCKVSAKQAEQIKRRIVVFQHLIAPVPDTCYV